MLKIKLNNLMFKSLILIGILISGFSYSQNLVINEVMSSNVSIISDEDGDFPDWIEIYNNNQSIYNLNEYFLSDDASDKFKWNIPNTTIEPYDFLLIFASGKDRNVWASHWETIIDWGDIWKYRIGTSEPPTSWNQISFDDTLWSSGPSGFGYGDGDDSTIVSQTISLYLRKDFTVSDILNIKLAQLHIDYDDAFVAYLNGIEIARRGIGQFGVPPAYNQTADELHEAQIYQGGLPDAINVDNIQSLLINGNNVLAIQVHNYGATSSDLTMIPFLTLGMNTPPVNPNGMPDLINFSLPRLHTNFKIKSSGEVLLLSDSLGNILDSLNTGIIPPDISLGRQPDGTTSWYYFDEATPDCSNTTTGYTGIVPEPQYSQIGGFYSANVVVSLSNSLPGSEIRYTTDGAEPTDASSLYQNDINISQTTVVRARSFSANMIPSKTITHTYFINESHQLPLISISTTPANLWDYNSGIYVMGPNAQPNFPHFGANFWQDWEKPIHIELYEPDGTLGFSIDAGIKIYGAWTRGLPQKSLAIFARGRYGYSEIDYQVFPDKPIYEFQSIILRNSGNDWDRTMFRDALMTGLVKNADIDIQAYRPSIVFLNGEFWGIHNIREKLNEHYLASNHGVDPDNVDLLELDGQVIEGDANHYDLLIDFLTYQNINDPANYEYVKTQMNVDNFINYQVSQIYFDNTDWPGNNIKFWRPRLPNGTWRWLLYDTDFGFGLFDPMGYAHNTLEFATEPNGPGWPNPPWSTFMLRKLLENSDFTNSFINRSADFLNYYCEPSHILQKITDIKSVIEPDMSAHFVKWGGNVSTWNSNINDLRIFAGHRPNYLRTHIQNKFNISGNYQISLNIDQTNTGKILINSLLLDNYPWNGRYFNNIPISVKAIPSNGYRFKTWAGASTSNSANIIISSQSDITLTAIFELDSLDSGSVVINEINYNSSTTFDPDDWVEFVNSSQSAVDISDWKFKDSDDMHLFTFPTNMILEPDSFVVICNDLVKFSTQFPNVTNCIGEFNFGLSGGGELVRLFDAQNNIIDSLTYDDDPPWPIEPDGNGPTLALKNPILDNAIPSSWGASGLYGTPGKINDIYTSLDNNNLVYFPKEFRIMQNYPNPFNPNTKIRFELAKSSKVKLEIFDINGRMIKQLLNKQLDNGRHEIEWIPGTNISSGIYFYNIQVNEKNLKTMKMIYMK